MKSKLITTLLCGFLGGLGIHRFYLGKIGTGILWILTGGLWGIGTIVDMVYLALDKTTDSQGQMLQQDSPTWLPWVFLGLCALSIIGVVIFTVLFGGIAMLSGILSSY